MKKTLFSSLILGGICLSLGSYVAANTYDDLVDELANSILEQIENSVEHVETTGKNIDITIDETLNTTLSNTFIKAENSYIVTAQTRNSRLNGGIILKEIKGAVDYLYDQKLTKYNTLDAFQPDSSLRRDEAAKFFSVFAAQVLKKQEDEAKNCTFNDLAEGHTDLKTNVVSACRLGIFKGSNGMFNPTASLTHGEALTVLIRILSGNMDESSADHWAKAYWEKAQLYGLTQGTLMDSIKYLDEPISRGDIARLLEAARLVAAIKTNLQSDVNFSLTSQWYIKK